MKELLLGLALALVTPEPAGVVGEVCELHDVLPARFLPAGHRFCDPGLVIFVCHDMKAQVYILLVWNEKTSDGCESEMERYSMKEMEEGFTSHGMRFEIPKMEVGSEGP